MKPFLGFNFGYVAVFVLSLSAEWSRLKASVDLPALLLQSKATESTPLNKLAVVDDARAYMPVNRLNMTLCQN